jgi:hypothetical protein
VERDSHRRIVGYVETTETEWDEEQQALVLALMGVEADTCSGCGLPLSEATTDVIGPDGEVDPVASRNQYEAKVTDRCYACAAIHRMRDKASDYMEPESLRLTVQKRGGD